MTFKQRLLMSIILLSHALLVNANQQMQRVTVSENAILLLDARLNGNIILPSLEAYPYQGKTLVAVEPLFDSLNLKYQLYSDRLLIWKNDDLYTFPLQDKAIGRFLNDNNEISSVYWFSDGYFLYMDISTLAALFEASFETNRYQLRLDIKTLDDGYLFPLQRLAILEKQRILAAALKYEESQESKPIPITIDDQYQLITMPNGRINGSIDWNDKDKKNNFGVQLASDLLYHSADITISRESDQELAARLRMSRFKTRPNELILGAFDSYSWGDISGSSNNLMTGTRGGLGLSVQRSPKNFRRKNLTITLQETAPPGWEAELFRNNQFITLTTVPNDGLLTFEDVLTEYGNNYFQIKLYSPFGEVQIIERYYDLSLNALTEGAIAYNMFAFDANHRMIDDQSTAEREVTDFGATLDYGIYDNWQIGLGFVNTTGFTNEKVQLFSLKNAFTLPGMLLENDTAINNEGGYAQMTSLIGNVFGHQRFSLSAESAENYISSRITAIDETYSSFSGSLSGNIAGPWSYNINMGYFDQGITDYWRVSNSLFTNYKRIYFSHTLNYFNTSNITPIGTDIFGQLITQEKTTDNLTGNLGISGKVLDNIRISGNINYDPAESSPILDNSSLLLEWNPKPFDINNYLTVRYQPLSNSDNTWQLSHRILWEHKKFQLTFSSNYSEDERWSLNTGIQFFLGYDKYNNRTIMRNNLSQSSATLDIHTYLDRQANGIPDPLDYDLEGVEFIGSNEWDGITSGKTGKTVLPGAGANGPFYFGAKWKNGAETVNKDYVVYTHPGARLNINMPFYLTSEIFGFVERSENNTPINNVKVLLKGKYTEKFTSTDSDGFFEFTNLQPDIYEVRIDQEFLDSKSLTSDIVGYRLTTPDKGGFVELDIISLERKQQENHNRAERIETFKLTINNSEALLVEDDPRKHRNYFNLPVKDKLQAPYVLPEKEDTNDTEPSTNLRQPKLDSGSVDSHQQTSVVALPNIKFNHPKYNKIEAVLSSKEIQNHSENGDMKYDLKENITNKSVSVKNDKQFTIQLGAYKQKEDADNFTDSLKGLPSEIEVIESGGFYKVITGDFMTKESANQFSKKYLTDRSVYIRKRNINESQ